MRDLGIEDDILANGTPQRLMGDTVFCTSLAGDEIGRVRTWGTHPQRQADYTLASPTEPCDLPQTLFEPILIGHAADRGSRIRFDTEYVGLTQDEDGVTVTVRDRLSGHTYEIRAKYVIGADGGRSQGRRRHRPPLRGPDGRRRLDEHRLPRRPQPARRAPPERPLLGAAARARTSAASAWAWCAWCARGTSG